MQVFEIDTATKALVLALSVCYHARLNKRDDYEEYIAKRFQLPLGKITAKEFQLIITRLEKGLFWTIVK